ncbi:MAG TPA: NAD(P)-dependent oxidoreductase [Candidatus Dormibacteraeota bacterium]|nr:NAD(P)-dependent oxidoreductase [Candidatus Dormibacteraeota bacterium]
MKRIGVIGTGIMGSGIVANYLKAGYEVTIWNRSAKKTEVLRQAGAVLAATPREVTQQADIIFEVTANDESSQAVWQGADGILAGADKDKVLIASATLSVDWTISLGELCPKQGFTFFDMPLTGGRVAAESGALSLLAGGNEKKLESLKPDLAAISSKVFYFGPAGSGMKYKLVLNGLQAAHIAAFGEAMRLAKAEGLDLSKVGPALCDRPGGAVTNLAWTAYQQDQIPLTFSVDWITKDLEYARQMDTGTELPILDDVLAAYQKVRAAGHGNEDWASINKT